MTRVTTYYCDECGAEDSEPLPNKWNHVSYLYSKRSFDFCSPVCHTKWSSKHEKRESLLNEQAKKNYTMREQ